jgi:FkbM family methyltransferase
MLIKDEHGKPIDTKRIERAEQDLAEQYILPTDCVLELGGRYGSVSCVINSKLHTKTNHVVVEPDNRVWTALESNRNNNTCEFHIVKGLISTTPFVLTNLAKANGYATSCKAAENSTIPHYSLDRVKEMFQIPHFTAFMADCEGCLGHFMEENPDLYDELRLFIFECDGDQRDTMYVPIQKTLQEKGFASVQSGFHEVWIKRSHV